MSCYNDGDFVQHWEENMSALGFWIPYSPFDAFGGVTAMVSAVATVVEANPSITLSAAFYKVGVTTVATNLAALLTWRQFKLIFTRHNKFFYVGNIC